MAGEHNKLFTDKTATKIDRPVVRLFSQKARDQFCEKIHLCDWSDVYANSDVNSACDIFFDKIQAYFNESFPQSRLSRKRARDKKWITNGLKKASRTKSKLYKIWLKSKTSEAESKYKDYKKIFKRASRECEAAYYKEMFDKKNNSNRSGKT